MRTALPGTSLPTRAFRLLLGINKFVGERGADTFIFHPASNEGSDTITDFDATRDWLDFRSITDTGVNGLAGDLTALATVTDAAGDVTLTFDAGTQIVFAGIGTGGIDELAALVADPGVQIVGWDALTAQSDGQPPRSGTRSTNVQPL